MVDNSLHFVKDFSRFVLKGLATHVYNSRNVVSHHCKPIRCNPDAGWALRNLIERAARLGAVDPEHYLLPHRAWKGKRGGDPTKPQESFLFSWRKLRTELAKKYPHLARLRFYDNRHTACTRLLENPSVPYNAVEHMMGHELNSKTKRIYDHVRNTTLHAASEALASGHVEIPDELEPYLVERKPPQTANLEIVKKAVEK